MRVITEEIKQFTIAPGDIVYFDDTYYLICPHPNEKESDKRYYLPSLDGEYYYGSNSWTLGEIEELVDHNDGKIFSNQHYEINIVPQRK